MRMNDYDKHGFGEVLSQVVSPSRPIGSIEHLIGRNRELDRIEKALFAPGRNVFIFGERGVGKSSLAATAANMWQSADAPYIDVSCAPDTTLNALIASIASQALNQSWTSSVRRTREKSIDLKYLSYSQTDEIIEPDIASKIHTLGDAVAVLREVEKIHSDTPVIVVDEVDRIASRAEVDKFADLLKQLGDKRIDIKFIFTGVGKTLNEILGAHHSAIRQLETIELPRLSWDARWDIAIEALKNFEIEIDRSIYVRIAAISDGYPYYVHLITEKLLWHLFENNNSAKSVKWEDYYAAINEAILSISAELARPYAMAVDQGARERCQEYEHIVWSTAADEWQGAYISDMYGTYRNIVHQLSAQNIEPLSYEKYSTRFRNLLKPEFGEILIKKDSKKGYYHYREKMLRGYIRMQAEANNVEIIGEEAKATIKQYMNVPARSVGYYKPSIPRGVSFKK